jgi:hypothetical protein
MLKRVRYAPHLLADTADMISGASLGVVSDLYARPSKVTEVAARRLPRVEHDIHRSRPESYRMLVADHEDGSFSCRDPTQSAFVFRTHAHLQPSPVGSTFDLGDSACSLPQSTVSRAR